MSNSTSSSEVSKTTPSSGVSKATPISSTISGMSSEVSAELTDLLFERLDCEENSNKATWCVTKDLIVREDDSKGQ